MTDSTSSPLQWSAAKPNTELNNKLDTLLSTFTFLVHKEIRSLEKQFHEMRKLHDA